MIFNEVYSAYYNVVSDIIRIALDHPVSREEIDKVIRRRAFADSFKIESSLTLWGFTINEDGKYVTSIKNPPSMPYTLLERQWLKAILMDRRMILFMEPELISYYKDVVLKDETPLYTPDDVVAYDQYSDGDDYSSEEYVLNFKYVLKSIHNSTPISLNYLNRKGVTKIFKVMPDYIEYSEKDDKFRLIAHDMNGCPGFYSMSKITGVKDLTEDVNFNPLNSCVTKSENKRSFVIRIIDERKALERVMLHFSHFEKKATKIHDNLYELEVFYDVTDEKEMVIRVLSFGSVIKVTSPPNFVDLIRNRLISQREYDL